MADDIETPDVEAAETPDVESPAAPPEPAAPAVAPATPTVAAAEEDAEQAARENPRKVREGIADSVAMDKTVVIKVIERVRHPRYAKTVQRTKRLYAHDETNDVRKGDRVRIQETRPLSKLKRWRVVEVLERAK